MIKEFKLPYTAFEINEKLTGIDNIKNDLEKNYYTSADLDVKLNNKANLVDGKVPVEQLPDDIGGNVDLSNYYTKPEADQALAAKADLVNGKIPSEQLPDDIGGGVTSWNDLEDKPFGESGFKIEWDGTPTEPFIDVSSTMGAMAYKVGEAKTKEELIGATCKYIKDGSEKEFNVVAESFMDSSSDKFFVAFDDYIGIFAVSLEAGIYNFMEIEFDIPCPGIWFIKDSNHTPTYLGKGFEIKKIDEKFLPDDIARKSDIPTIDLSGKADLIDGKVPLEQLPDNIGDLIEIFWEDVKNRPEITTEITENSQAIITSGAIYDLVGDCNSVINSIKALVGGEGV